MHEIQAASGTAIGQHQKSNVNDPAKAISYYGTLSIINVPGSHTNFRQMQKDSLALWQRICTGSSGSSA